MTSANVRAVLFDWGDTVMRVFPEFTGPMHTWPQIQVVQGVQETLAAPKSTYLVGLATNAVDSDEEDVWAALRRGKVDHLFDVVYYFRTVGYRKPSLEFFRHVLADLQCTASEVVMVGDEFESDIAGANAVGMPAVWFNQKTDDVRKSPLHVTIHNLKELPKAIKELKGLPFGTDL